MKRDSAEPAPEPAQSGPVPGSAASWLEGLVAQGKSADAYRAYQEMGETERGEPGVDLQAARAASFLGDLDAAGSLVESALVGYESGQNQLGRISAVNVHGAIAFERGEYATAAAAFHEVFEVAVRREDYLLIARSLNNLASVASVEGRSTLAVNYYRSALLAYRRLRDYRGQVETFCNLGIVHRQAMEFEEAERAFEDALYHAGLDGDPYLLALAWTGRAELHLEKAALTQAAKDLTRADELAFLAGDEIGKTEIGRIRALLALAQDEPVKAHALAGEIRERARRRGLRLIESKCCAISACALKRLGDLREAESFRAKAAAGLRALGAKSLLERFERDWEAS